MFKILFIFIMYCTILWVTMTGCSISKSHIMTPPNQSVKNQSKKIEKSDSTQKMGRESTVQNKKATYTADQPESISVLVNKHNKLPKDYKPADLVYANIPFIFPQKAERGKMRKEAAEAIEKLFAGAKKQGIHLLGVSAYRSYLYQMEIFKYYVEKDGYQKAISYSAIPGTSEHETGLAIDVTGANGKCPAEDCFGNTKEAKWLQANAAAYGFIIRYPKGKEPVTGYEYEPWHLRYVGNRIAKDIMSRGITLEDYYHAVPVGK